MKNHSRLTSFQQSKFRNKILLGLKKMCLQSLHPLNSYLLIWIIFNWGIGSQMNYERCTINRHAKHHLKWSQNNTKWKQLLMIPQKPCTNLNGNGNVRRISNIQWISQLPVWVLQNNNKSWHLYVTIFNWLTGS